MWCVKFIEIDNYFSINLKVINEKGNRSLKKLDY